MTYFSCNFGWYSNQLDIVRLEQGDGEGGLLNEQNPFSVTKDICRRPLI